MNSTAKAVQEFLSKIERTKDLNIFLEVWGEEALDRAKKIDLKISNGKAGKLAGMIIALKDNICYRGHKVSAASKILEGFESQFSATAVERLLAEDAVFIGRTNCDEFAMGSANENSAFGAVKNPINPTKVPGGSSGGSAAAVAAGLCHVALGSDTGGSIRQPAAFTGTVGFKPSYGRISRHGLIAYASSFDQIGPLATNVSDAAKVIEVMAGPDEFDSTAIQTPIAPATKLSPKKIAYLKTAVDHPKIDESVKKVFQAQLELLENAGCEVEPVEFELLDALVPVYYILTTAEASSNLARFDGVHAGFRAEDVSDLESVYKKSRSAGFGKEVQRRIMLGTFVLSAGYYDAYFGKAQAVRRMVKDWTDKTLSEFDVLLCPTTPSTAFELGREVSDPTVNYLEDIFTVQANIAGTPAVSIPIGVDSDGLPIGLQVMGANGSDMDTLAMAEWIQKQ
ncbi:MAG: Asp-tRNA(Asn)/Glu-tRNA(Gln) amidotransferase subunit GatA [Bacteroidota bacterium]|nr:Asp-tRNA(Asn)/Glu-tRNA(Gln) amidotransferase subunit GatA [Bacteroidota bacterium]